MDEHDYCRFGVTPDDLLELTARLLPREPHRKNPGSLDRERHVKAEVERALATPGALNGIERKEELLTLFERYVNRWVCLRSFTLAETHAGGRMTEIARREVREHVRSALTLDQDEADARDPERRLREQARRDGIRRLTPLYLRGELDTEEQILTWFRSFVQRWVAAVDYEPQQHETLVARARDAILRRIHAGRETARLSNEDVTDLARKATSSALSELRADVACGNVQNGQDFDRHFDIAVQHWLWFRGFFLRSLHKEGERRRGRPWGLMKFAMYEIQQRLEELTEDRAPRDVAYDMASAVVWKVRGELVPRVIRGDLSCRDDVVMGVYRGQMRNRVKDKVKEHIEWDATESIHGPSDISDDEDGVYDRRERPEDERFRADELEEDAPQGGVTVPDPDGWTELIIEAQLDLLDEGAIVQSDTDATIKKKVKQRLLRLSKSRQYYDTVHSRALGWLRRLTPSQYSEVAEKIRAGLLVPDVSTEILQYERSCGPTAPSFLDFAGGLPHVEKEALAYLACRVQLERERPGTPAKEARRECLARLRQDHQTADWVNPKNYGRSVNAINGPRGQKLWSDFLESLENAPESEE